MQNTESVVQPEKFNSSYGSFVLWPALFGLVVLPLFVCVGELLLRIDAAPSIIWWAKFLGALIWVTVPGWFAATAYDPWSWPLLIISALFYSLFCLLSASLVWFAKEDIGLGYFRQSHSSTSLPIGCLLFSSLSQAPFTSIAGLAEYLPIAMMDAFGAKLSHTSFINPLLVK